MSEVGQRLIALVREVVAERPDFVYPRPIENRLKAGCVYVRNGQPSCLIGHALWRAGLIDAEFEVLNLNDSALCADLPGLGGLSADEFDWLGEVQYQQDCGATWATAVGVADNKQGGQRT